MPADDKEPTTEARRHRHDFERIPLALGVILVLATSRLEVYNGICSMRWVVFGAAGG